MPAVPARLILTPLLSASIVASLATFAPEPIARCSALPQEKKVTIAPTKDDALTPNGDQHTPTAPPSTPDLPPGATPESLRRLAGPTALDLEDSVLSAELILVVRLVDVTESRVVHGGKQEVVTQQYRFEPVRTLKGVYARDALLMTDQDLRLYQLASDGTSIERGQLLLLLLGRSGPGWFNCNGAGTLGQSIPKLADADDPLLKTVETLIRVTQEPDRLRRVATLQEGLDAVQGRAALPLLNSIRRRAALAGRDPKLAESVARVLDEPGPIAREAAAQTLAELFATQSAEGANAPALSERLRILLADPAFTDLRARGALIEALAALGPDALPADAAIPESKSLAERAAWLRALAVPDAREPRRDAILNEVVALSLDASDVLVRAAFAALTATDAPAAADRLHRRALDRISAGLGIANELELLGALPADQSAPLLVALARWPLAPDERQTLASSSARLADPRLVPVLASLLDPAYFEIRDAALRGLEKIDNDDAAKVLWPHLAEEGDLARKLRLAAFLGRHGYQGGYPFAIEHLSDPNLRDLAVDALGDIEHPDAIAELRRIYERSNDLSWNAAAMRGLARLGDNSFASAWLDIARDPSHPLAPAALRALADLKVEEAIPAINDALTARGDALVIAAARAAAVILKDRPDAAAHERLGTLLADRQASQDARRAALDALVTLDAPTLAPALEAAVRDASIEGTPLLADIERRLRQPTVNGVAAGE